MNKIEQLNGLLNKFESSQSKPIIKTKKGHEYEYTVVKTVQDKDHPEWSLILIPKDKELKPLVFKNVFSYTEGWSQGTNRSTRGYYLETISYGGAGNGSGQSSKSTPYLGYRLVDHFAELIDGLDGSYYSKSKLDEIKDILIEFEPGTKINEIKSKLR